MDKKIQLSEINVGDRLRQDLGDVHELAESIRDEGLIEPIVLSSDNRLVAGGRRYAAHELLATGQVECNNPDYFKEISFVTIEDELRASGKIGPDETISPARLRLLEIEENVRRKSMSWKEEVVGISEYHRLKKLEAGKDGDKWTQSQTGKLLGVFQAHVSPVLTFAKELKNPDSPYHACASLREALQLKVKMAADEATKLLAQRVKANRSQVDATNSVGSAKNLIVFNRPDPTEGDQPEDDFDFDSLEASPLSTKEIQFRPANDQDLVTLEDVSELYFHGDGIEMMRRFAAKSTIHHIMTDPPYGIDMKNLAMRSNAQRCQLIDRVAATHQVNDNIRLLGDFLGAAFDCIHEAGFLCMWYDLDHHNFLCDVAAGIGWKVCRWPFHWVKTSSCANQAAQFNLTKAVEHCLILRRSEKSTVAVRGQKNYIIEASDSSASHPFYKPYSIWKTLIEIFSREGQTLFDPFVGEGSMLVPAFTLGRVPYGAEIDETHIANGIRTTTERINKIGSLSPNF